MPEALSSLGSKPVQGHCRNQRTLGLRTTTDYSAELDPCSFHTQYWYEENIFPNSGPPHLVFGRVSKHLLSKFHQQIYLLCIWPVTSADDVKYLQFQSKAYAHFVGEFSFLHMTRRSGMMTLNSFSAAADDIKQLQFQLKVGTHLSGNL